MLAIASQMLESANRRPGHILIDGQEEIVSGMRRVAASEGDSPTAIPEHNVSWVETFGLVRREVGKAFGAEVVGIRAVERGVASHEPG